MSRTSLHGTRNILNSTATESRFVMIVTYASPRITPGLSMVASLASLISGAALVSLAERHPRYVAALELGAGVLLIGGLALLGATLPFLP